MLTLLIGLALLLIPHFINLIAPDWRAGMITKLGERTWKLLFSLVSVIGLILLVMGYGAARMDPVLLWFPPVWLRHLVLLLMVPASILIAAAYVPGNRIKAKLGHPMYAGIKTWALAHLLANGTLADVVLFGSFLVWAIAGFAIQRRRDRQNHVERPAGNLRGDLITVISGIVVWAVIVLFLHTWLIGVNPLPL